VQYGSKKFAFFGAVVDIHYPTDNEESFESILARYGDLAEYERGLSRLLYRNIRRDELFLDIGAQIGLFSVLASLQGARVVSFEMRTSLVLAHYMTCRTNGFRDWLPLNMAVDSVAGVIPYNDNAQFALTDGNLNARTATNTVLACALDEIPGFLLGGACGCIKMDIEGFEVRALRGMRHYIAQSRPFTFIECHPHPAHLYGTSIAEIPELFPGNYDFFIVEDHRNGQGARLAKVDQVSHVAENFLLVCSPQERRVEGL